MGHNIYISNEMDWTTQLLGSMKFKMELAGPFPSPIFIFKFLVPPNLFTCKLKGNRLTLHVFALVICGHLKIHPLSICFSASCLPDCRWQIYTCRIEMDSSTERNFFFWIYKFYAVDQKAWEEIISFFLNCFTFFLQNQTKLLKKSNHY